MPLSRISTQPRLSFVWSRPTSSPTISERRSPPAKPISSIARSRSPQKVPRGNVSSMAIRCSGSAASFWRGCVAWRGVGVADRGEHSSDMAVLSVERCATPGIIPGQRRKSPLDRLTEFDLRPAIVARGGDPVTPGGTSGDVEADRLWVGRKHPTLAGGTTRNEMAADHCGAEMSPAAAVLRGGEEPAST